MKRYILSAILGALVMLLAVGAAARLNMNPEQKRYVHMDYVSNITSEACYICSDVRDFAASHHWGEDNVGIVNLNTFELLHLSINPYDECGKMIEQPIGAMFSGSITNGHAFILPDSAFADASLSNVSYEIDRESVQEHLCQECLDSINSLHFSIQPPSEFAVISYEERTIQPLLRNRSWFSSGNFGIACEFREDGRIDLLIHYIAYRETDG